MPSLFIKIPLFSFAAALLLVLTGCETDGRNASDNPTSAPQFVSDSGNGGSTGVEPLPEAGTPLAINSQALDDVVGAKAVMDGSGNVTVVWTESDGATINLWSSRYTVANNSWSSAQKLEGGGSTLDVKEFQVVIDTAGYVTVVWTQTSSDSYTSGSTPVTVERTDLWATRFTPTGWETEAKIENSDLAAATTENIEDIGEFQVVVDSATPGNVSVLWTQHSGSLYDLYATRNVAGVWDVNPTLVDTDPTEKDLGDVTSPQLLLDASGNLFALWTQSNGSLLNLWGAHFGGTWSAATKIDSEDLGNVETPKAVVDSSGNATVAWRQFTTADNACNTEVDDSCILWTARYSIGTGTWGAAALAETAAGNVGGPQLLAYGTTQAMLLWVQAEEQVSGLTVTTLNNVRSKHHDGTSWVDDGTITNGAGDSGSIVMVKDSADTITAAWVQYDSDSLVRQNNLWANRFSAGSWGVEELIESQNSGDVSSPMLLVDGSNRVSAIWLQKNTSGLFDLWSNHYLSGGWGTTAGLVEGIDDGSAVDPHAVMNSSGNITLVWRQPYGTGNHLVTSLYTAGTASDWGDVAKVESSTNDGGYNPLLLVDNDDMVTVIWLQPVVETVPPVAPETTPTQTVRIDLWANRF